MTPEELRDLDRQVAEHEGLQNPPSTDRQIARAAFSFFRQSHPVHTRQVDSVLRHKYTEYTFDIPGYGEVVLQNRNSKFGYKDTDGNEGYGLWLWEQRDGQPWQAALEAAVAAWRGKPRCYSTDWSASGPLIEKYGLTVAQRGAKEWNSKLGALVFVSGETPLIAICRAVLALPKEAGR